LGRGKENGEPRGQNQEWKRWEEVERGVKRKKIER
jgi:hypothetical protein